MRQSKSNSRIQNILKLLVRGIRHLFLHNGWVKLIAILISVILWAGLISQDPNLTRDKAFQNVTVNITGTDTMKRNGYIVISDLDELLSGVNATAAVPQQEYDSAEISAYNLRVDLSSIKTAGEQEIKILNSTSSRYGQITGISPSSIKVNVEKYIVRNRIPVTVTISGDVPEGWYIPKTVKDGLSVDPQLLTVGGPESLVRDISRGRVNIDLDTIEWKEGTMQTTAEIRLYNRSGDEIDKSQLTISTEGITIDSVLIETTILPSRTYFVADAIQLTGEPAEGYQTRVRVSPESVRIAARSEVLDQLDDLPIEPINVTGLTESIMTQLKIQKPSEDAVLSNDTVTITVEIIPVTDEE